MTFNDFSVSLLWGTSNVTKTRKSYIVLQHSVSFFGMFFLIDIRCYRLLLQVNQLQSSVDM